MKRSLAVAFLLALLLLLGPGTTSFAQEPDEDWRMMRVYFQNQAELNALANRIDIWEVNREGGYVLTRAPARVGRTLLQQGLHVSMGQGMVHRQYLGLQLAHPRTWHGISGYPCYRTVEETYDTFARLAERYPKLARWQDVGDSWEKVTPGGPEGYDLMAMVLTNQDVPGPKPKLFIIAAIHAREYVTAELATRFAEHLLANYGVDADITWLLDHYECHIMPQVNPDGRKKAETGELWRKNTDDDDGCTLPGSVGVDLNRNSSFKWNHGGASSAACSEIYLGPEAASEPEVQAIQHYARSIFADHRGPGDSDAAPDDTSGVFITLHSYSQLVLFPWIWTDTQPAPNARQLQTLGRKFGYFNRYTVCSDCLYSASGTTDDFVYGDLGVASYTFELGTQFFQSCNFFEQDIIPKNMPALLYAFKAARQPYLDALGPDVLDVTLSAPAVAAGTPITLTASADDTRYASGQQGEEPVQVLAAARYTLDAPSWENAPAHIMRARDGAFDATTEIITAQIDTTGLTPGRHTLFIEAQDADGNWGVPTAIFLTIIEP